MQETWKAVVGYEGLYEVSNKGGVRSIDRYEPFRGSVRFRKGKSMKHRIFGDYLYVPLSKNGIHKTALVHRLVAEAFILNPENKPKVNHKDFNPLNNQVENLEWCTQQENITHSVSVNRHPHGESHGSHKLTEADIINIRAEVGGNHLAKKYDVSYSTIKRIRSRKLWRHVA